MESINSLKNLSKVSQYIGNRVSDVQGGGGNTSVKYKNFMAVKASGYSLKDLTYKSGFAVLDNNAFIQFLSEKNLNNNDFDKKLSDFLVSSKYRKPSMEAGLHSILKYKYVAHTHSAYVNIFTCAKEGRDILNMAFPDALWVDYATPGLDLFKQVNYSLKEHKDCPKLIFLQNHGLFISSNDHNEVIEINNQLNNYLIEKYSLERITIEKKISKNNSDNLLFPDQAVYLENIHNTSNFAPSNAASETMCVVEYITRSIDSLGLTPNYLSKDEKNKLLNLESEKYRKKLEK